MKLTLLIKIDTSNKADSKLLPGVLTAEVTNFSIYFSVIFLWTYFLPWKTCFGASGHSIAKIVFQNLQIKYGKTIKSIAFSRLIMTFLGATWLRRKQKSDIGGVWGFKRRDWRRHCRQWEDKDRQDSALPPEISQSWHLKTYLFAGGGESELPEDVPINVYNHMMKLNQDTHFGYFVGKFSLMHWILIDFLESPPLADLFCECEWRDWVNQDYPNKRCQRIPKL